MYSEWVEKRNGVEWGDEGMGEGSSPGAPRRTGVGTCATPDQTHDYPRLYVTCRASGTATPTPAKSWWLAAPRILVGTSLRRKPVLASQCVLRNPMETGAAWVKTKTETKKTEKKTEGVSGGVVWGGGERE